MMTPTTATLPAGAVVTIAPGGAIAAAGAQPHLAPHCQALTGSFRALRQMGS